MPARLHHERITSSDASPARWFLLTHGMYGAGSNWRGIARKLTTQRPEWGVVLVDLRQHGRSEGGDPPHTLAAAADDVRALVEQLDAEGAGSGAGKIEAIGGHSFGGKVVLAARPLVQVRQTWLLDSSPSRRPDADTDRDDSVVRVLELLERLPRTWPQRADFVAAVMAEGQTEMLAQWLAMSVIPDAHGTYTLLFDTVALREMLMDYYAADLWDSLRDPAAGEVELVIADKSPVFTDADRAQLASPPPHVHVHHIDAGHWLHIAAPGPVVDLLASHLP